MASTDTIPSHESPPPEARKKFIIWKSPLLYVTIFLILLSVALTGGYFVYVNYIIPSRSAAARDMVGMVSQPEIPIAENTYTTAAEYEPENEDYAAIEAPLIRLQNQGVLALRETFGNDDIIGRLWINGTNVDYVVVQGEDNQFYLSHDIWGNASSAGWIFLDYMNDIAGADQNIVLYGHNMAQDIMFHGLRHYADYEFFTANRFVNFSTLYADYTFEVFAFYTAHISFPYTHVNFESGEAWGHWLQQFAEKSIHESGVNITPYDRIITLSTCTNGNVDERFVLQARLVQ